MKYLIERINVNSDFSGTLSFETDSLSSVYYLLLRDFCISEDFVPGLIRQIKSLGYGDFLVYKNIRVTNQVYNADD